MRIHYTTVKLPELLLDEVKDYIEKYPKYGYINPPDFIRDAIRDKLNEK